MRYIYVVNYISITLYIYNQKKKKEIKVIGVQGLVWFEGWDIGSILNLFFILLI